MDATIEKLNTAGDNLRRWAAQVRPPDGNRGRFRWAVASTRDASIPTTFQVLCGMKRAGVLDTVIDAADRAAGLAWLDGMEQEGGRFVDPTIWQRPSPQWPPNEPWPSPPMRATLNQNAQGIRGIYRGENVDDLGASQPPEGWPGMRDDPAAIVEWIRRRPFAENAWGAGSHATRMICFMLNWHARGLFPLEPIADAVRGLFEIQDPSTGLWGTSGQPRNVRINGAFKLFVSLVDQLALPVPHGRKLMDQVLDEITRPDYAVNAGGCDEYDNWYVLSLLREQHPGYREEAIRREAGIGIHRMIADHTCPDGGFSYSPHGRCATAWNGIDMCAESTNQGDGVGVNTLSMAVNLCVDVLGLHAATPWTGEGRMRQGLTAEPVKAALRRLVGDPGEYAGRRFTEHCTRGRAG